MKHRLLQFLALATSGLSLAACSAVEQPDPAVQADQDQPQSTYVLQARSKKLRTHHYKGISTLRSLAQGTETLKYPEQYLGRGYRIGDGIIGHPSNLGLPVLDAAGLVQDPNFRDLLLSDRLAYAATDIQTSTELDSKMEETLERKKLKSGFVLDLGFFSIGAKKSYTDTFHSLLIANRRYAKGRLSLLWYERMIRLASTDYALKKAAYAHLSKSFAENLYNSTMFELLQAYGPLVVTGYYTGGRATNEYLFEAKDKNQKDSWHHNVNSFIGASFSWDPRPGSNNGNKTNSDSTSRLSGLFFGARDTNGTDLGQEWNMSNVFTRTRIYGGAKAYAYTTPPQAFKYSFVDLGPWFQSLSDEDTHTLVDIADQGLVSLDHFILESNFRKRLAYTLKPPYPQVQQFGTPYVHVQTTSENILLAPPNTPPISPLLHKLQHVGVLHTRHGDDIILIDKNISSRVGISFKEAFDSTSTRKVVYEQEAKALGAYYTQLFECEIKVSTGISPSISPVKERPNVYKTFFDFQSPKLYKYKNPQTNICYIYDETTKSAFSYYDDGEDSILDDYGLASWAEGLPTRKISIRKLAEQYTVIGL